VFLINCILSVRSDDCQPLINLITDNKLYLLNASDNVVFYPIDFKFITTKYRDVLCPSGNCFTRNELTYKNKKLKSLSDTDLAISDKELSKAIYNSMTSNTQLYDVIRVFPNRFVMKSRTEKNTYMIYWTVYSIYFEIPNPACDRTKLQYRTNVAKI